MPTNKAIRQIGSFSSTDGRVYNIKSTSDLDKKKIKKYIKHYQGKGRKVQMTFRVGQKWRGTIVDNMIERYEMKMRATEERMRALGLLTPMSVLTLDEWEIPRDRVVINRSQ